MKIEKKLTRKISKYKLAFSEELVIYTIQIEISE